MKYRPEILFFPLFFWPSMSPPIIHRDIKSPIVVVDETGIYVYILYIYLIKCRSFDAPSFVVLLLPSPIPLIIYRVVEVHNV